MKPGWWNRGKEIPDMSDTHLKNALRFRRLRWYDIMPRGVYHLLIDEARKRVTAHFEKETTAGANLLTELRLHVHDF